MGKTKRSGIDLVKNQVPANLVLCRSLGVSTEQGIFCGQLIQSIEFQSTDIARGNCLSGELNDQ